MNYLAFAYTPLEVLMSDKIAVIFNIGVCVLFVYYSQNVRDDGNRWVAKYGGGILFGTVALIPAFRHILLDVNYSYDLWPSALFIIAFSLFGLVVRLAKNR